jgi:hypothetical protein
MQSTQLTPRDIAPESWNEFLSGFTKRNEKKPTRLEAVGFELGAQVLEKGLPLVGVSFEPKGSEAGSVEIVLGGESPDGQELMEHLVLNTTRITPLTGHHGVEDGLGFESLDGTRTLLIFEELPELPPPAQ